MNYKLQKFFQNMKNIIKFLKVVMLEVKEKNGNGVVIVQNAYLHILF